MRTIRATDGRPRTRRSRAALTTVVLVGAMLAAAPPSGAGDLPTTVQNLQYSTRNSPKFRAGHGLIVFQASEGDEQRDLNGDGIVGDTNTIVHMVWDSTTGQTESLMGAGSDSSSGGEFLPNVRFGEGIIAYSVSEATTKRDLNGTDLLGDGDMSDDVMHVWTRSGGVVNTGFDVPANGTSLGYEVGGGKVVFTANERELHPELIPGSQDLNGDGDALDEVVVLEWDEATGVISLLGTKTQALAAIVEHDGLFAWEALPGTVNTRIVAYDAATATTEICCAGGLYFAAEDRPLAVRDGYVGLPGQFAAEGTFSLVWWDVAAGPTGWVNTGLAADFAAQGVEALDDGWMAVAAVEASTGASGTDLNGDGDTLDDVLHLWDPVAGSAINSGLAVDRTYEIVGGSSVVAFVVDEAEQGADLNGDGDTSSADRIVHVWDVGDPAPTNLLRGMDKNLLAVDGDRVVFGASQDAAGVTLARRVHAWTPAGGLADLGVNASLVNSTWSGISASDGQFAFMADETASGVDLDGNGTIDPAADAVPTVWDPVSGLYHAPDQGRVFARPDLGAGLGFTRSHALFSVFENVTQVDLNCDGDATDNIVHVVALAATPGPPPPCDFPVIIPGSAVVTEGDSGSQVVQIPVTLSGPSAFPVTVDWATFDNGGTGIATEGDDFVPDSGAVTFAPGDTSETVELTVNSDLAHELPALYGEWALLQFSNPSPQATIGGFLGFGVVIILDDDPEPVITAGAAVVDEGDVGSVTVDVPVTLSNPSQETITVEWATLGPGGTGIATEDVDYSGDSGTLTFLPGDVSETVTVSVNGDTVVEPPLLGGEWGFVALSAATNATVSTGGFFGLGIFVIADDDVP